MPYDHIVKKIKENSDLSETDIEQKVKEKLDALSGLISKEGAAHIIANELGVNIYEEFTGRLQMKNIIAGMRNVEILGKVQNVFEIRDFTTDRGSGKVGSFFVADETGSIRATCWHAATQKMEKLKQGEVVKIKGAYVKDNQGRLELHLNDKSEVVINPPGETIGEVAEKPAMPEAKRKKISDLSEADTSVKVLGTIVQAFDPRFFEICPECGKRIRQREDSFVCEAHNKVTPDYSFVMNCFLDDGSENIRAVFFREQAVQLINKSKEDILKYRELPEKFEEVKNELLGKIVKITGRVTKNTMFDRIELLARDVDIKPDPEEELAHLKTSN